jgi:hypothetical protein
MAGRSGFFGGPRQGEADDRDAGFGVGSDDQAGGFVRLGDSRPLREIDFSHIPGFDPIWGTLGAPASQSSDPWQAGNEEPDNDGPIVDVEIFGNGFEISGRVCVGQFPRLSDWLNMQQGFIRVQEGTIAHIGRRNMPDQDGQQGSLWVRSDQIVIIAERAVTGAVASGAPAVPKQRRKAMILVPGYSLRGSLHVHAHGSMKQFLETPDPRFIPITDTTVRWTDNPEVVSRFPFALINRHQLISVLDEPTSPAGENGVTGERHLGEMPLHRASGAA